MADPRDLARAPTEAASGTNPFACTVLEGMNASGSGGSVTKASTGCTRYELSRVLGEGGMGRVLEARDRQFSRVVAVKHLLPELRDSSARERFTLEALVTGNLEHSGVPTVYEQGELEDGSPFYAMNLVQGRTLAVHVTAATSLEERLKLIPAVIKVAQTLGYAHERGVVHRDIKPENIVVGAYGEVVVLDWGIAKVRGVPTSAGDTIASLAATTGRSSGVKTIHGSVIGTPAYMSPEQANGHIDAIDERTDVFALGALLYHLLVGHAPYDGTTTAAVVAQAAKAEPVLLAKAAAKAPRGIREICEKAMAREPRDRYRTAAEVAAALEAYVARAVARHDSGALRWVANGLMAVAVLLVLVAAAGSWHASSTLREQGVGGLVTLVLSLVGITLGLVELWTRGRYKLAAPVLACALATLCGGIASTFGDLDIALRASLTPKIFSDPVLYRELLTEGAVEALGSLAQGAAMAAVQLILWGIGRRASQLAAHE